MAKMKIFPASALADRPLFPKTLRVKGCDHFTLLVAKPPILTVTIKCLAKRLEIASKPEIIINTL